jgi:hypothetical protein
MLNLPKSGVVNDSSDEVKDFFDQYFKQKLTFPAAQIDAVIGYFLKRGFSEASAKSTSIVLLTQARQDDINVFRLLDTLTGLNDVQLSKVVTEVLNTSREKTSMLGYKILIMEDTLESRNIRS